MNKSTKWFLIIVASIAVIGVMGFLTFYAMMSSVTMTEKDVVVGSGDKIAIVELKEDIIRSEDVVRQLKKYRQDRSIKAILFRVDSPGGGVAASQEIYEEVKKIRREGKPIVVSMGSVAASGGYYVSVPANRIVANRGTITGSIGVISQFMRLDSLLGKVGVTVTTVKSGRFKDVGNPYREMTDRDKLYLQALMDEVHQQFITAVTEGRNLSRDSVIAYADGRIFTGEQAVTMGLVDTIGTYEDAILIAAQLAGIDGEPSVVKERKGGKFLFDRFFGASAVSDLMKLKEEVLHQPLLQYRMQYSW